MHNHSPAIFVGDAVGLDFLNSLATPVDTPIDWIANGEGFLNWLRQADQAPSAVLEDMGRRAAPGELDQVAEQARDLREWFRGVVHRHKGRPLTREVFSELAPLNRLLERDEAFARIVLKPQAPPLFELQTARRWRNPEALLTPVAEAVARVICTEDFTHIKACEGPTCTLLFADHTRGRARRWCSMALCGNRAKQATHRRRAKGQRSS